ncbi:MAG TPA: DUF6455 family protein [Stellaceae bacterium]|nr:DUF6455 family protein [Stellaceae bacterium]
MTTNLDRASGNSLCGTMLRWVRRAQDRIADAWARDALRYELEQCELSGDIDIILADAGLTRSDIGQLIKGHPEATRLFRGMSERLDVAAECRKDPHIQREMERACALCTNHKSCRRWLRYGGREGYHAFCPNAPLLDLLRRRSLEARGLG